MAITTTISATVDLDKGATVLHIAQPFATFDNNAHIFAVRVGRSGVSVDIAGATCVGYFVRADGVTVPIDGAVTDSRATVTLAPNCYAVAGRFELAVKLSMNGIVHTILRVDGLITVTQTDAMASPGDGVQSFDMLVEAAETVKQFEERIVSVETANAENAEKINQQANRVTPVANGGTGNTEGKAASAAKLATAHTIQTDLGSTAAASFDGSANIAPGVKGILPMKNGGHGANNAAGARQNLGVPSVGEMQQRDRVVNLLDNSWFVNPINQRGLTQYTGNCYTIDRWYTYSSGAIIVVNNGYITITASALMQKLNIDPDKTYTAAVKKLDGTVVITSGTFTEGFGSATIGIRCSVSEGYCRFLIEYSIGDAGLLWAALYEGKYTADTLPAYVYKGYAAELAECRRYYENSWFPQTTSAQNQLMGFVAYGSYIDTQISYRESKRANPVITLHPYDPATYTNWRYYNGSYYEAASQQSLSRNGRNGFWVRLEKNAGDTVTKGYSYTVEGHWEANAEL